MNIYETDKLRSEYLLFHFGSPEQILSWPGGPREALEFPARIVERFSSGEVERALDLGCAVGRSAFELSRAATEVVALDYSQAFVDAGREMQSAGRCEIARLEEGKRSESIVVLPPPGARPDRIAFEQGDAMALRADLGSFDRVLAANLLCRLADPARLLARLPELVKPGGELILTTPCTWLEDFTPRDDDIVIMGEDVGYFGGVFRCTAGLQEKHGKNRVFDTPISECGIIAAAVGMGAYGLRPVPEIQFADYIYPGLDQLISYEPGSSSSLSSPACGWPRWRNCCRERTSIWPLSPLSGVTAPRWAAPSPADFPVHAASRPARPVTSSSGSSSSTAAVSASAPAAGWSRT